MRLLLVLGLVLSASAASADEASLRAEMIARMTAVRTHEAARAAFVARVIADSSKAQTGKQGAPK